VGHQEIRRWIMPVTYSAMNPTGKWTPGRREHEEALRADDLRRGLQQYLGEAQMAQQANQFGQEMAFRKLAETNAGRRFEKQLEQRKELTEKGWEKSAEQAEKGWEKRAEQAGLTRKHQTELQGQSQNFMRDRWRVEDKMREAGQPTPEDIRKMHALNLQAKQLQIDTGRKQLELASVQPDPLAEAVRRAEAVKAGYISPKDAVDDAEDPQTKAALLRKYAVAQANALLESAPTAALPNAAGFIFRTLHSGQLAGDRGAEHLVGLAAGDIRRLVEAAYMKVAPTGVTWKKFVETLEQMGVIDAFAQRPDLQKDGVTGARRAVIRLLSREPGR
jgi:hypothetical protein